MAGGKRKAARNDGSGLENRVANYYKRMGKWGVKKNVILKDARGNRSEIDVVAGRIFKYVTRTGIWVGNRLHCWLHTLYMYMRAVDVILGNVMECIDVTMSVVCVENTLNASNTRLTAYRLTTWPSLPLCWT